MLQSKLYLSFMAGQQQHNSNTTLQNLLAEEGLGLTKFDNTRNVVPTWIWIRDLKLDLDLLTFKLHYSQRM